MMERRSPAYRRTGGASDRSRGRGPPLRDEAVAFVLLLPLRQNSLPFQEAEVIHEENAIEVVDLVLDRPRGETVERLGVAVSLAIGGFQHDFLGSGHVGIDLGNRQAAFFGRVSPLGLHAPRD